MNEITIFSRRGIIFLSAPLLTLYVNEETVTSTFLKKSQIECSNLKLSVRNGCGKRLNRCPQWYKFLKISLLSSNCKKSAARKYYPTISLPTTPMVFSWVVRNTVDDLLFVYMTWSAYEKWMVRVSQRCCCFKKVFKGEVNVDQWRYLWKVFMNF